MSENSEKQSVGTTTSTQLVKVTQKQAVKRFLDYTNRIRLGLTNDLIHGAKDALRK